MLPSAIFQPFSVTLYSQIRTACQIFYCRMYICITDTQRRGRARCFSTYASPRVYKLNPRILFAVCLLLGVLPENHLFPGGGRRLVPRQRKKLRGERVSAVAILIWRSVAGKATRLSHQMRVRWELRHCWVNVDLRSNLVSFSLCVFV